MSAYKGYVPTVSTSSAGGVWTLREQLRYQRDGVWPISQSSTVNFSDVSLLLHGNGQNGGTVFTDSSLNNFTLTRAGNTITSTAQFKYGTASILFDGSGDYLSLGYNSAIDLIGSSFTIECWVRPSSFKPYGTRIFSTGGGGVAWNNTTGIHTLFQFGVNGEIELQISSGTATPVALGSITTISLNTWKLLVVNIILVILHIETVLQVT